MKVLMLAEVCNPYWPSLPGFSYSLANTLGSKTEVTLVTHVRNKENIEKEKHNFSEIIYIDNEYIASPLDKLSKLLRKIGVGGWMTNMGLRYPAYIAFEKEAKKLLKMRFDNKEFDIIHRISPVSPTLPSLIASNTNIPFILGPINGSLPWPKQYKEEIKKEREFVVHLRGVYKFLPYYESSFSCARHILAAFEHVKKDIPESCQRKLIKFDELGVDTDAYKPVVKDYFQNQKLTFLFVGRLVPYKGAHIVINAFAESKYLRENHRLIIVGDGPDEDFLHSLVETHNLNQIVNMVGWKNQVEVAEYMCQADVFVFPTIREVGGNVIIEAMASGLPVIAPDYGGPRELINEKLGFKIQLSDKKTFLNSHIEAMETLARNHELRQKMSIEARKYVLENYSWNSKADKLMEIYKTI